MSNAARLIDEAIKVSEEVLTEVLRVDLGKAEDPLKEADFLKLVNRASAAMRSATAADDRRAVAAAVEALDQDWPNLSNSEINRALAAASAAVFGASSAVAPKIEDVVGLHVNRVVRGTRTSTVDTFSLGIDADPNAVDEAVIEYLSTSQAPFVRDHYGRRARRLDALARGIIAAGLAEGLSRDDITENLTSNARLLSTNSRKAYWNNVAAIQTNRARSFGQMSSFSEAGIRSFQFEAVMDERTTDICRYMHGRVFSVGSALQQFVNLRDAEATGDDKAIAQAAPFVNRGVDGDGNRIIYANQPGGRLVVAQVVNSAVGTQDRRGTFARGMGEDQLERAGIMMPPLHGRCRSTIVPV